MCLKQCNCNKCTTACYKSTGWFGSIEEIEKASKIKDMTIKDFFNEYIRLEYIFGSVNIPKPKRIFLKNGGVSCIFYENNECSIHESKPTGCYKNFCCLSYDERIKNAKEIRRGIFRYWRDNQNYLEKNLNEINRNKIYMNLIFIIIIFLFILVMQCS